MNMVLKKFISLMNTRLKKLKEDLMVAKAVVEEAIVIKTTSLIKRDPVNKKEEVAEANKLILMRAIMSNTIMARKVSMISNRPIRLRERVEKAVVRGTIIELMISSTMIRKNMMAATIIKSKVVIAAMAAKKIINRDKEKSTTKKRAKRAIKIRTPLQSLKKSIASLPNLKRAKRNLRLLLEVINQRLKP